MHASLKRLNNKKMHLDAHSQPLSEKVSTKSTRGQIKLIFFFFKAFKGTLHDLCHAVGRDIKEVICKIRYQELRSIATPARGDKLLFVSGSEQGYQSLTPARIEGKVHLAL